MISSRFLRIALFILIPLVIITISSSWIMEWLWLREVGYVQIFWTLRITQLVLIVTGFAVAGIYLVLNFRYLAKQIRFANFSGTPLQNINIDLADPAQQKRIRQLF